MIPTITKIDADTNLIILTDISPTVEIINTLTDFNIPYFIIDHHENSDEVLSKIKDFYIADFSLISSKVVTTEGSASEILFNMTCDRSVFSYDDLETLVTAVSIYDTWEFSAVSSSFKDTIIGLNILFYEYGKKYFYDIFRNYLSWNNNKYVDLSDKFPISPSKIIATLNSIFNRYLDIDLNYILSHPYVQNDNDKFLKEKNKLYENLTEENIRVDNFGNKYIIKESFAYCNRLADSLRDTVFYNGKKYSSADIDYIVFVDIHDTYTQYGLRSVNPDVDVSEIARSKGGNGHKAAAGFRIQHESILDAEL